MITGINETAFKHKRATVANRGHESECCTHCSAAGLTYENLVILMVHLQQPCVIPCRFVLEINKPACNFHSVIFLRPVRRIA
jgi:hypothetical protein